MLNNTTQKQASFLLSSKESTFLVIFNSLQIILGSAANMFEILFFLKNRHVYKSVSDKLTLNLAIADFVALTTYLPWRTYLLHIRRTTRNYKYYTSLFVFCIFTTGNAIVLVGIDRFMAITRPLRYRVLVAGKVFWLGVTLAWGIALALGIGHYLSYKKVWLNIHKDYEFFLSCLSIGHMTAMSIVYTIIIRAVRQNVKSVAFIETSFMEENPHSSLIFYYKKSVYITFSIVCLFYVTFLPYSVYRIITHFDDTITKTSKRVTWRWLMSFTFLNSCLNPYIYLIRMQKFRSRLKVLLNNVWTKNENTSV